MKNLKSPRAKTWAYRGGPNEFSVTTPGDQADKRIWSILKTRGINDETIVEIWGELSIAPRTTNSGNQEPMQLKQIDKINGMAQRCSYVFTADKTGFVNVFDVRNPRNPALHDTLDAYSRACQSKPHDIAVFGERIIVVDSATDAPAAVQVYRVAETSANTLLPANEWELEGSIPAGDAAWDIGGANRVAVSGSYAYVGAYRPDRVAIIDISDPKDERVTKLTTYVSHP